jgi:tripartite-type tricarboxylate transporter receptor subunit TctC
MLVIRHAALGAAALAFCALAQAQEYPTKTVTVMTSIGAGSPTEQECRGAAQFIEAAWKKPFLIEPRPGAGGSLAAAAVAKSAPDGHTLFCTGPGITTFKLLIKDLSFDPLKDLVPVTMISEFVGVYAINAQAPYKTFDEFVAYARANPGKLNFASAGRNSVVLSFEALKRAANINLTEIPYPGTPQFVLALARNDVQIVQAPIGSVKGQIDSGALRPILVNGNRPALLYPGLPTPADKKLNLPLNTWTGIFAPAGTPKAILDRLAAEVANYAQSSAAKKREADGFINFFGSTPEQFKQLVDNDAKRWGEIVAALGWKPE